MWVYTKYKYPSPRVRTPAQIKAAIAAHKRDVFLNELSDAGISSPVHFWSHRRRADSLQSAMDKLAAYKAEKAKIAAAPEIEALLREVFPPSLSDDEIERRLREFQSWSPSGLLEYLKLHWVTVRARVPDADRRQKEYREPELPK